MTETEMNYNEIFFKEGFFAVALTFAGVKLETFSQIASTCANLAATVVAITAIYTFIKKEIRERKKGS